MLIPVILCGGSGTRLWPLSRAHYPKQFLAFTDDADLSLLQRTIKRVASIEDALPPLIVTHQDHRFLVAEQLRNIDTVPSALFLEPVSRNTAPATAVAALWQLSAILMLCFWFCPVII